MVDSNIFCYEIHLAEHGDETVEKMQHHLCCWGYTYSISREICTRLLLCCGYTSTDFPISIRLTSLALWQSNDCPSASKATLMNMDKYFMWIHYERLHNHYKAKHNKTVCIFPGIYCIPLIVDYYRHMDPIQHSLQHIFWVSLSCNLFII